MTKAIAYLAVVLAITFAISPFWVPEFGGFDPDQFPVPQDNPPVQPAGYAFAIWGLIYLWLLVGMVYGAWRRSEDAEWHMMRVPLCVSLAIGSVWLPVAVASPVWASILIWGMLITALTALFRAPHTDKWWALMPIGLYAGWLSAASCVSLGLLAAGYGYLSADTAAFAFVFLALVLASAVQNQLKRGPTYGVAVVWALIAIVVQNLDSNPTVAALAFGGALTLCWTVWKVIRSGGKQRPAP